MEAAKDEGKLPRDAPTLPRYPTLIRETMPRGAADYEEEALSAELPPSPGLFPPPRFPSMKDVTANKAGRAEPQSTKVLEESVGRQLEQQINAALERTQIEKGVGAKRAADAASKQWSSSDQRHLNALLRDAEGHLPTPRQDRQLSIDTFPTATSEGAAIRAERPVHLPRGDTKQLVGDVGTAVGVSRAVETTPPRAVSAPFPSAMATVPLTMFKPPGEDDKAQVEDFGPATEEDMDERLASMVRSKSVTAQVSITGDFGLKGGHDGVVRDSVFLDGETLVTAGDDGKVCFWDLKQKYVKSEFMPYNGHAVQMLYPIVEEDGSPAQSLITLSEDRLLRVWSLVEGSAVLLRSMQIPHSGRDLVMSVPVITPRMKAHAAASAAASAVTTTELTESAPASLDEEDLDEMAPPPHVASSEVEGEANEGDTNEIVQEVVEEVVEVEENVPEKRFSFNLFGKNRAKKALAS